MRIYLPTTLPALADVLNEGRVEGAEGAPLAAYAVTDALRAEVGDDEEELSYEAMLAAADASLELLAADPAAPRRRVVLAADAPDHLVTAAADPDDPARIAVAGTVPRKRLAAGHVDDEAAAGDIAAGRTDDHALMWFAVQELRDLVA